jgi:hypothetical protein
MILVAYRVAHRVACRVAHRVARRVAYRVAQERRRDPEKPHVSGRGKGFGRRRHLPLETLLAR